MKTFPVGNKVKVTVEFHDLNGDPVSPTGLSWRVLDETGTELSAPATIAVQETDTSVDIEIPAIYNSPAGARTVEATVTTANGDLILEEIYLLKAQQRLVILDNTFQTYAQAIALSQDMPNMLGWMGAEREDQQAALIEAFTRLVRMSYLITWPKDVEDQSIYATNDTDRITPSMWPLMTEELFAEYPDNFLIALRKAQVAEANSILTGDPIGDKRRKGVMSESVGESSMMFRPGVRPLETPVSRDAMNYLTGFIDNRLTITRS